MNIDNNRNVLIMLAVGFVLVIAGAALPFFMVQHIIKSTLLLNFIAFTISVSGLFLGVIGGAMYIRVCQGKNKER